MDLDKWFASEEGKKSVEQFWKEIEQEEILARQLEEKSNLKYPNGQKVKRGDVFIDLEAKEGYEIDPDNQPYGYHKYVYRINEDETVDICLALSIALKMNNCHFDFNNAELVERNYKLKSPFDDIYET